MFRVNSKTFYTINAISVKRALKRSKFFSSFLGYHIVALPAPSSQVTQRCFGRIGRKTIQILILHWNYSPGP